MIDGIIEKIESNLFELVGQIDYGEISNIETYWASLTESLQKLTEFGYDFSSQPESLSDALTPLDEFINDNLKELADEMEFFCEGGGSTDNVDEDEIAELQDNAIVFEEKFLELTNKLRQKHGE